MARFRKTGDKVSARQPAEPQEKQADRTDDESAPRAAATGHVRASDVDEGAVRGRVSAAAGSDDTGVEAGASGDARMTGGKVTDASFDVEGRVSAAGAAAEGSVSHNFAERDDTTTEQTEATGGVSGAGASVSGRASTTKVTDEDGDTRVTRTGEATAGAGDAEMSTSHTTIDETDGAAEYRYDRKEAEVENGDASAGAYSETESYDSDPSQDDGAIPGTDVFREYVPHAPTDRETYDRSTVGGHVGDAEASYTHEEETAVSDRSLPFMEDTDEYNRTKDQVMLGDTEVSVESETHRVHDANFIDGETETSNYVRNTGVVGDHTVERVTESSTVTDTNPFDGDLGQSRMAAGEVSIDDVGVGHESRSDATQDVNPFDGDLGGEASASGRVYAGEAEAGYEQESRGSQDVNPFDDGTVSSEAQQSGRMYAGDMEIGGESQGRSEAGVDFEDVSASASIDNEQGLDVGGERVAEGEQSATGSLDFDDMRAEADASASTRVGGLAGSAGVGGSANRNDAEIHGEGSVGDVSGEASFSMREGFEARVDFDGDGSADVVINDDPIDQAFEDGVDAVRETAGEAWDSATDIARTGAETLREAGTELSEGDLEGAGEAVRSGLEEGASELGDAPGIRHAREGFEAVADTAEDVADTGRGIVDTGMDVVSGSVGEVLDFEDGTLPRTTDAVRGTVGDIASDLRQGDVMGAGESALEGVERVADAMTPDPVEEIIEDVVTTVEGTVEQGAEAVMDFGAGVAETGAEAAEDLDDDLTGGRVGGFVGGVIDTVAGLFGGDDENEDSDDEQGFGDAVGEALDDLGDTVEEFAEDVGDAVGGAVDAVAGLFGGDDDDDDDDDDGWSLFG